LNKSHVKCRFLLFESSSMCCCCCLLIDKFLDIRWRW